MPNSPTANMALVLPTDHSDTDVWGALLADVFALIGAHDHTAGKGVRVTAAALRINADLPFSDAGAYYAATSLKAADFQPVNPSDVVGYAAALFVSNVDNNLYWRTTAGANVKVTDGTTLNVAGFTGGIGGDYASVGALLSFTDSTDSYSMLQQDPGGGRPWARLRTGDLDLYQAAAGITNRVRIASPAALAASYALTLPGAAPGSTQLVQVTSAGVMSFSNSIAESMTLAAGKDVTVSGGGKYKRGSRYRNIDFAATAVTSGALSFSAALAAHTTSGASVFWVPLSRYFADDEVLATLNLLVDNTGSGSHTYDLVVADATGAFVSVVATVSGTSNTPTITYSHAFSTSYRLYLKVTATSACTFGTIKATTTIP